MYQDSFTDLTAVVSSVLFGWFCDFFVSQQQ
jgi:hypothetical protein